MAPQLPFEDGFPFLTISRLFRESYLIEQVERAFNLLPEGTYKSASKTIQAVYTELHQDIALFNEEETRAKLVDPVLAALGFDLVRGKTLKDGNKPDYLLTSSEADAQALREVLRDSDWAGVSAKTICVCEAKPADTPLGRWRLEGKRRVYPQLQIADYLSEAGVRWGILTNGLKWRLVCTDTAHRLDSYVEFDLGRWWSQIEFNGLKPFFVLFSAKAFEKEDRKCVLERLYEESLSYGRKIEDDLCDRAFRALEIAANGFYTHPENRLKAEGQPSAELLHDLWNGSMRLLYRILFVLNAEDRGILPVSEPEWRDSSLTALRDRLCESGEPFYVGKTRLWNDLQDIFHWIDQGREFRSGSKMQPYNGKLFSRTERDNVFLEEHSLDDKCVADLVRELGTTEEGNGDETGPKRLKYDEMQLRHLGRIYEGLLENSLFYADEDLVIDAKKEGWHYKPRSQVSLADFEKLKRAAGRIKRLKRKDPLVPKGALYVATDKRERKQTGTYYTPDFVVSYIVDQTVEPLCDALRSRPDSVDATLGLRILDPAAGSGHFLVRAAERVAEVLATDPHVDDWLKARGFADVMSMSDSEKITFWRRIVVERCVYGVDINPLAVELAKVSLWMLTLAKDKPLSFLDHHIRCGDSLLGTTLFDEALGQIAIEKQVKEEVLRGVFDTYVNEVLRKVSERIEDVKYKDDYLKEWEPMRNHLRRLADLQVLADVFPHESESKDLKARDLLALADAIVAQDQKAEGRLLKRYDGFSRAKLEDRPTFHWEVEFPEVFLEPSSKTQAIRRRADAGFDAVISNPPYVRQERLKDDKKFLATYYEVAPGNPDLYAYFFERAHKLLRPGGLFGFICSNKFLRADYGRELLDFLSREATVRQFVDFGELPVFPRVGAFPAIFIHERGKTDSAARWCNVKSLDEMDTAPQRLEAVVKEEGADVPQANFAADGWIGPGTSTPLLDKLKRDTVPLGDYVDGNIKYGIKTGFNDAFIIDAETRERLIREDPKSVEIIKPVLMGDDVRKWHVNWCGKYLIVTRIGVGRPAKTGQNEAAAAKTFEKSFPAVYRHLKQFEDRLRERQDQGEFWWELRACDYYDMFEQSRIVYPVIAKASRWFLDNTPRYSNDKTFVIPISDYFLLAILNSRCAWAFLKTKCSSLGDVDSQGRLELRKIHMVLVPIKAVPDKLSAKDSALIARMRKSYDEDETEHAVDSVTAAIALGPHLESSPVIKELLAFLAERIQEFHASRSQRSQTFFSQMRTELGIVAKPPTKRGIPLPWWDWSFDDFAKFLRTKKVSLLSKSADLRPIFDSAVSDLKKTSVKIDATDALIDRLVYALYGLTEDEIAIVEGRAGRAANP